MQERVDDDPTRRLTSLSALNRNVLLHIFVQSFRRCTANCLIRNSKHRGTWDIILSYGTTTIACTWSIQHLNVPAPSPHDGTLSKFLRTCKWMIITRLFPEFIMAHAVFGLVLAVQATDTIKKHHTRRIAKVPWLIRVLFPGYRSRTSRQKDDQNIEEQRIDS